MNSYTEDTMNNMTSEFDIITKILKDSIHELEDKRILLIGSTGAISTYLGKYLIYIKKNNIINIDLTFTSRSKESLNKKYTVDELKYVEEILLDVRKPYGLNSSFDYIIFAAGNADPKNIIKDPINIIDSNYQGLYNLLSSLESKGTNTKIIFFSTREVYGLLNSKKEITENDIGSLNQLNFRSCYPEVKKLCENMLECVAEINPNISYSIIRLAHIYGPFMNVENDGRIMNDLIGMTLNGKGIKLLSDGSAIRAFCYVADAVTGIITAMSDKNHKSVFNLANEDEPISIKELAFTIQKLYPERVPGIAFKNSDGNDNKNAYFFKERMVLSTERIRNLGWKPHFSLNNGLKLTINSYL